MTAIHQSTASGWVYAESDSSSSTSEKASWDGSMWPQIFGYRGSDYTHEVAEEAVVVERLVSAAPAMTFSAALKAARSNAPVSVASTATTLAEPEPQVDAGTVSFPLVDVVAFSAAHQQSRHSQMLIAVVTLVLVAIGLAFGVLV